MQSDNKLLRMVCWCLMALSLLVSAQTFAEAVSDDCHHSENTSQTVTFHFNNSAELAQNDCDHNCDDLSCCSSTFSVSSTDLIVPGNNFSMIAADLVAAALHAHKTLLERPPKLFI